MAQPAEHAAQAHLPDLPTGTVTFRFTDVDGTTTRWEQHPGQMRAAVEERCS